MIYLYHLDLKIIVIELALHGFESSKPTANIVATSSRSMNDDKSPSSPPPDNQTISRDMWQLVVCGGEQLS